MTEKTEYSDTHLHNHDAMEFCRKFREKIPMPKEELEMGRRWYFREGDDNNTFLASWKTDHSFEEDGQIFNSVQQYTEYKKAKLFKNEMNAAKIMASEEPIDQKHFGYMVNGFHKATWDEVKDDIRRQGHKLRFEQNDDLKMQLVEVVQNIQKLPKDAGYKVKILIDLGNEFLKNKVNCTRG